jgi:hypothetical protein
MRDAAHQAHGKANEWCFIANSVNFPVRHEPVIDVAARGNPVAAAGNAGAAGGNPGEAEQKSREAG